MRGGNIYHLCETSCRHYVTGVYKAVQVSRRLFDGVAELVIAVYVEDVRYKIQCILVVLDFGV